MNRRTVLSVVAVSLSGCASLDATIPDRLDYELRISCHDYTTRAGEDRDDCTVYLHVDDLADAAYVEMRVVNRISGETDVYTVDYDDPVGVAHTGQVGDRELEIRDRVVVAAVYPDGDRDQLEHVRLGEGEHS